MKERNRIVAILLAIMMVFTYMPALAFAETETEEPAAGGMQTITLPTEVNTTEAEVDLADSDELLMGYMEKSMEGKTRSGMLKASSNTRGSKLEGNDRAVYDLLKVELARIASGEINDATIVLPLQDINPDAYQDSYTAEDLEVEAIVEDGEITEDAYDAMCELYSFDFTAVFNALLADMPYEMYWFDKSMGCMHEGPQIGAIEYEDVWEANFSDPNITFYFSGGVAKEYQGENVGSISPDGTFEVPLYTVARTEDVSTAIINAQEIINRYSGDSDLEKLIGYRDEICDMTDYNNAVADDEGNPWQMIWVFDGNEDTNVVCEGYSKAFQFLCDNTYFNDSSIECHSVSGKMNGGTGAGDHMWNILHMDDGKNYIADITNCDDGAIGSPDKLFLKGYSEGDVDGYYYNFEDGSVYYSYDDTTWEQFSADELTMSEADYEEGQSERRPLSIVWDRSDWTIYGVIGTDDFESSQMGSEGDTLTIVYDNGDEEVYTHRVLDLGDDNATEGYYPENATSYEDDLLYDPGYTLEILNESGTYVEGDNLAVLEFELDGQPIRTQEFVVTGVDRIPGDDTVRPVSMTWDYKGDREYVRGVIGDNYIYGDDFYYEGNELTISFEDGSTQTYICKDIDMGDGDVYTGYFLDGDISGGEDTDFNTMQTVVNSGGEPDYEAVFSEGDNLFYIVANIGDYEVMAGPYSAVGYDAGDEPVGDIESISFSTANGKGSEDDPIELREGIDGCYKCDSNNDMFFFYEYDFKNGDSLTINYKDNSSSTYIFDSEEWEFLDDEGNSLDNWPDLSSDQYSNHWTTKKSYAMTLDCEDCSCDVWFKTVEIPYSSASFIDVAGRGASADNPIELIEGQNGYITKDANGNEFFVYDFEFKNGDALTLNYEDEAIEPETYYFDEDEWDFYNADDEVLRPSPDFYSDQWEEHWVKGNVYEAHVAYSKFEIPVYFKIIENPVKAIVFSREGGVQITEGVDGVNSDGGDNEFLEYHLNFKEDDIITLKVQEEGEEVPVNVRYIAATDDEGDIRFVNEQSREDFFFADDIDWSSDEQSFENEWKYNDGKDHWFTISYQGVESEHIPVTMLQNPVSNFIFERSGGVKLMDGVDGVNSDGGDGSFFEYYLDFKPGDLMIVTKPNETVPRYYEAVAEDEDSSWVSRFVRKKAGEYIEEDYIDTDWIEKESQPNQRYTPWTLDDGIDHSFILRYSGRKFTVPVTLVHSPVDDAIAKAESQANDAAGKAAEAEQKAANSTNESDVSAAESSAAKAVELADAAEAAAKQSYDNALAAYNGDQSETAKRNLDVATANLAAAKMIKAAANSSYAVAKKAAAKVAANKAAAASAAASNATDSAAAEALRKEAEAQAAKAAANAKAAEEASAKASKAVADIDTLAASASDDVKAKIEAAKSAAQTAASTAATAATAAKTSSTDAKASEAKAKTAVDKKTAAEKAAADKAAAEKAAADKAAADKAAADKAAAEKAAADKAAAEKAAADKAAAEKAAAAAEAKAKKVKTVTVNTSTVTAKAIDKAVKAKGGSNKYVTKIILGKKVKKISKNAFKKYKKVKTLEIKTKKLKKASVKGSLKGSKITTIKVKIGKKSVNKKFVKSYKKIFTKTNAGKKVTVK